MAILTPPKVTALNNRPHRSALYLDLLDLSSQSSAVGGGVSDIKLCGQSLMDGTCCKISTN